MFVGGVHSCSMSVFVIQYPTSLLSSRSHPLVWSAAQRVSLPPRRLLEMAPVLFFLSLRTDLFSAVWSRWDLVGRRKWPGEATVQELVRRWTKRYLAGGRVRIAASVEHLEALHATVSDGGLGGLIVG